MKSLMECITEARVSKMNRKKFIDALASYGKENGYTETPDNDWLYKSYPKENTMKVTDDKAISFHWDEGKTLTITTSNQNGRLKNSFKVLVSSYTNKGYSISNHPINFTGKADETFDPTKMPADEVNDILEKIKTLIDKKKIDKIFKSYYKMRDDKSGYAYKYDDFDHSQINYDDIK